MNFILGSKFEGFVEGCFVSIQMYWIQVFSRVVWYEDIDLDVVIYKWWVKFFSEKIIKDGVVENMIFQRRVEV